MAHDEQQPGALPTTASTHEQRVVLVESLLVTWKVLEHLQKHEMYPERFLSSAERAGCCRPDGGTCCVNRK